MGEWVQIEKWADGTAAGKSQRQAGKNVQRAEVEPERNREREGSLYTD